MMEVEVGRHTVLLARTDGKYSAIGNQCTHYGAPLSKGVITGHRVRCPWHGSCFNVQTGDLEEFPGIDCLPCHKVRTCDKTYSLRQQKRIKSMGKAEPGVTHTVLLLGGGAASLICAEILRQENFVGRIIMVTRDDLLPYDKTRLSKVLQSKQRDQKTSRFSDEYSLSSRAKGLDVPGIKLDNVKMLETPEDARQIHAACQGSNIVLVGTSFVGMEVASYMIGKASSITVIGSSELPYQNTLGREIGRVTMTMLSEKDVKFYMNDSVIEVKGVNGKVKEVVLKSGTVIPADVLIVGVGKCNADFYPFFLSFPSLVMNAKNFVIVDKCMRTNVPDVFSGGDVVTFPLAMANNRLVTIGHWQMAQAHGRIVALNILNKPSELNSVPYYWTVLLGKTIRYTGYGEGYTDIVIKGRFEERKFLALYIKNDEVIAAAGLNYDPVVSAVAERLAAGKVITKKEAQYVEWFCLFLLCFHL
uniref:Rieske domain-containing protein n=1 Tax=Amphiprion ocellaris TaxID=80972 RepID=A0AAQ6A577_AMPOC